MTVDEQRIRNVARNDASLIDIELVNVFNDVDTAALRCVGWLNNPKISLRLILF